MKTVDITYAGRTVSLAHLPEYLSFYKKLAAGLWEPRTFDALAKYLDANTVLIDIGAWIGVTPFWSAQQAKGVIAVEPDPKCLAILQQLAATQPKVTVLAGALANTASVTISAAEFGASNTSI